MIQLRTVTASRYVTPLREGGSLPAVVEADDEGMYVLKFRGAGQGPKALIAELLAGEIGRLAGLPVPEIVFAELPAELARTEPDPEIQSLIRSSAGLNIALDYLPGSMTFDPLVHVPDAQLAVEGRRSACNDSLRLDQGSCIARVCRRPCRGRCAHDVAAHAAKA